MKTVSRYLVFGFLALGLVLGVATNAAALSVTSVDGDWANAVPDVTINNSGTAGGLSTARWGTPAWPNTKQSGYNFESKSTPITVTIGDNFALGTFTHLNYPITGTSLESIDLVLNLGIEGFSALTTTFDFLHDETPNPAPDLVTITNGMLDAHFISGGIDYYFNLLGFSTDGGKTITNSYITKENCKNTATLYGLITTEPVNNVPVPAPLLLLGSGLLGLFGIRRKNQNAC